jgi:CO/xanthine dehydrogenase Mo-binding subunit
MIVVYVSNMLSSPAVTSAIANAIYGLTGQRKRSTPFDLRKENTSARST